MNEVTTCFFSLYWLWPGGILIVGLLLPALFWKRRRLAYASTWCLIGILGVVVLWLRDLKARDSFTLDLVFVSEAAENRTSLRLESGGGGMAFEFFHNHDERPQDMTMTGEFPLRKGFRYPNHSTAMWVWTRRKASKEFDPYPSREDHIFDYGGIGYLRRGSSTPPPVVSWSMWVVYFPIWLAISPPFLLPAIWGWSRYRRWATMRYRYRHNLCQLCGYSLQGLTDSKKCPECGIAKSIRKDKEISPGDS